MTNTTIPPAEIFKAYDIRGIVDKTLTVTGTEAIGRAIGAEALARGRNSVVIGRDGRLSGPALAAALARGLQASGVDVKTSARSPRRCCISPLTNSTPCRA